MVAFARCRATRGALRRTGRAARKALAAAAGPLLTAGGMALPPVAVTAAVAAGVTAAVAAGSAVPAKASTGLPVAVVLVNGESSAPETAVLTAAGYTVTQVTPATLAAMSQSTFQGYAAVVIGDSSTSSSCSTTKPSTSSLGSQWEGWVNGNVAVLGTAPAMPGTSGANALIADAVGYAATQPTSGSVTGLYVSLNCGYSTSAAGTAVSLLNGVDGIGTAGGVTVNGSLACTDPGMLNKWEASAAGTFGGFTSASLGTGSWPSPACPVQEAFDSWPAMFTPVAYDAAPDAPADFTASDGATGQPYILLGAPISAGTQSLAPGTGGEVPTGATVGGVDPTAPGVTQESAGDGVDTESGDFSQSATDFSIPTFGPMLDFTRTYDAQLARQETVAEMPGPMGYGWTDNWETSLSTGTPVPGDIYTIDGKQTADGNGGVPTSQTVWNPGAVAQYGGDTYIADTFENRVEEIAGSTKTQWGIAMTAGHMYTVAGSQYATPGQSVDGTPAASTLLNQPQGVVVDASGLYIADTDNCRVDEMAASGGTQWGISMTAGDMYHIAGSGVNNCGTGVDNIPPTQSRLDRPTSVSLGVGSHDGDVYIADSGNNRIQEIPISSGLEWGQQMTGGNVYTVAGDPGGSTGTSASGGSLGSSLLSFPEGVKIGGGDNLYIADTENCRVMEAPWASGTNWGISMTAGNLYTVAGRNGLSNCGIGDDAKSSIQSDLSFPTGVWAGNGNLYIADAFNNRVQEVAGSAHTEFGQTMLSDFVYTVAGNWNATAGFSGDGGIANAALMHAPGAIWVDGSGNLWVADSGNNRLREVNSSTSDISTVAGDGGTITTWGNGGPAVGAAVNGAADVAADPQGDLFIADSFNNRVQEIAASTHTQFGIAMTAGDVYTVAGSAVGNPGSAGDGGAATAALLSGPAGVAVDSAGNLYIVDSGNNRVQEVSAATGDISTIAGSAAGSAGTSGDGGQASSALLNGPESVAVDSSGNVYIADTANNRVQEIAGVNGTQRGVSMTAGDMYTVAGSSAGTAGYSGDGGAATSALLSGPDGMAVDQAGNLYFADGRNDVVREVAKATHTQWAKAMTAGDIYTVAGNASLGGGHSGDAGPATSAALNEPDSVAVDPSGDLYIAEFENGRIQEVPAGNGTQWSQSMTAADIYTVAGSAAGITGESGDGGPAASAEMLEPSGIAIDNHGNLFAAGEFNVREIVSSAGSPFGVYPSDTSALGVTITQPDTSQVTFYPKTGTPAACAAPYVVAGSDYCTLPQNVDATLTLSSGTYTYSPSPGAIFNYDATSGALQSESDAAGDTLTITPASPAPGGSVPGNGTCPSTASSCATIMSPSGRALIVGSNSSGLVTSVTDPMGRRWTYAYNSASQLTMATDPMGNVTSYTYGAGSTGNPQLASDMLTITSPNAQPGGPDAGDATVNVYDSSGRVTSQTDPMGYMTTVNYCVNAAAGDCMNTATGTGFITVSDPDGNSTVYDYLVGTLAAQSTFTGTTLNREQDDVPDAAAGVPNGGSLLDASATDGNGKTTTYAYNAAGRPISSTEPSSAGFATVTNAYTSNGQPSCGGSAIASAGATCQQNPGPTPVAPGGTITAPSSAPPAGITWSLYDASGNELYSTVGVYPPGNTTTASYLQTTYQLFRGNTVTLNGTTISCTYTPAPPSPSLPCAKINADGVVTQLGYDSAGDLTSSSTPDGNGSELATTTYLYDGDGEQTSTTAPDGNVAGASPATAANFTTTTSYSNDGQEITVTQAGATGATATPRATTDGYDANGNQVTVKSPRGFTTTTTYNADNKATLVTDPDGHATLTCYDGDGNVAQTVPSVGVAANSLTAMSCPSVYPAGYSTRLAADATVDTFNALGQKTQETAPAPAGQSGYETTTYAYDADGNLTMTTAPPATTGGQSQVTADTYTPLGQVATETTGSGTSAASTISYCYDPDGNQTSVVYADGNTSGVASCETSYPYVVSASAYPTQAAYQTTYSYDSADEQVSTTAPATSAAPSGATTTSSYDPAGNKLASISPGGITTTYTFTPGNLQTSVSYSGSSAHSVTSTYDADGSKTSMTDATGTSSYAYDPFGELTSVTNGAGQAVNYSYDADGNIAGISYPLPAAATWATSHSVTYGYDNADHLASVTDFNGNQLTITNTANGDPDSISVGSTGDTLNTTYDQASQVAQVSLNHGSSVLGSFSYGYSPVGTIVTETDTPASAQSPATYSYDTQGRVTSMTPGSSTALTYAYDPSGNLTTLPTGASATSGYDHAGELTSSTLSGTTTSYTYKPDGERLTAIQGSTTLATGTWNGAGQLTAFTDSAAQMSAATYDGNGLRAATTITPSGNSAISNGYIWDTSQPTPQLLMDSANAYIYDGDGTPAEQVSLATGAVTYLVSDALGSVRGTVSSAGSLTGTVSYDAWGNPSTAGGLTATTPFGFAGGYTDPTGLVYLEQRYYDPQTGQFTSLDPLVSQTLQPYSYAGGDPVDQVDPTGTSFYEGDVGASWGGSGLQWCVGVDAVVTAQVCGTFTIGKAYTDYKWGQHNWGRRHVTVLNWYPVFEGYTCVFIFCHDTQIQHPRFEMKIFNPYHKSVFTQWSKQDNSEPSTDYFAPGGAHAISVGRSGKTVERGSYIDFYLWVEADEAVRGEVKQAHAGQQLWTHY